MLSTENKVLIRDSSSCLIDIGSDELKTSRMTESQEVLQRGPASHGGQDYK